METDSIFFLSQPTTAAAALGTMNFVTLPFPFCREFFDFFRRFVTKTVRIALERRRTPLAISVCDGGALLFKQDEERPGDGGGYGGFCPLFQPRSTRVWFRNRDEKNEREKCDSRCVDEPIPRERFLPEGSRRRWPRKKTLSNVAGG